MPGTLVTEEVLLALELELLLLPGFKEQLTAITVMIAAANKTAAADTKTDR
jgi:hypothetical protein